jgi:hypothetical protein
MSKKLPVWVVVWDNGHACGVFPFEFSTKKETEAWARDWKREMVGMETTPKGRADARREYQWEVERAR